MKKILLLILLFLSCCKIKYVEVVEYKEVEKWIENVSNKVLLTTNEILKHNENINKKTNFYDLERNYTKEEIKNLITFYQIPSLPKYDLKEITQSDVSIILENRNIENIKGKTIEKAIVIKRTNLKSFPTMLHFYPSLKMNNFDALQETELTINTPLQILHTSKDNLWVFVVSNTYAGWVLKEDIAYVDENNWNYFILNDSFAVITNPFIKEYELDMGVTLPFEKYNNNTYYLTFPIKDKNGYVTRKTIKIDKKDAYLGYVPYTEKNIYLQAFRYLNTSYGWGGVDNKVDCSSMIKNIYKTFGFVFPRNTSEQRSSVGLNIISLEKMNVNEKRELIRKNPLSLLYMPGHGMIYLGNIDGIDYILHASGTSLKVVETNLENTYNENYLSSINYMNVMKRKQKNNI